MICDSELCTGCGACYNICPKEAINMQENEEGFLYPKIDEKKCVNCNLCEKTCPVSRKENLSNIKSEVYAAINKDGNILMKSSSGGLFSVLAEETINKGGYVYGSIFDEQLNVIHTCVNSKKKLEKLRGSKYVQSNVGDTFKTVKKQLESGQKVLYSGTPCQIAGLKAYLNKEYENLITVDLICHGVPSQKFFNKYIKHISKGKEIKAFKFRNKDKNDCNIMILSYQIGKKKKEIRNPQLDPYYNAFLSQKNYRESCYQCKYANLNRVGDFTLGDFWGVEKYHKKFNNDYGVSVILINTKKAKYFFEENIKNRIIYEKTNIEYVKVKNQNLNAPSQRPQERDNIYTDLNKYGFKYITKKYLRPKNYIIIKLKSFIPIKIKNKIKIRVNNIKFY